jgi:hypothetical protein
MCTKPRFVIRDCFWIAVFMLGVATVGNYIGLSAEYLAQVATLSGTVCRVVGVIVDIVASVLLVAAAIFSSRASDLAEREHDDDDDDDPEPGDVLCQSARPLRGRRYLRGFPAVCRLTAARETLITLKALRPFRGSRGMLIKIIVSRCTHSRSFLRAVLGLAHRSQGQSMAARACSPDGLGE